MLKLSFLEKYKEYGVIFIRLIVGFHLVFGTQDNVFSYARMTLIIAHIGDAYPSMFPALMMLSAACFFLIHGPGKLSVDDLLERRRNGS